MSLDLVTLSETERDVTAHVILEHVQIPLRHCLARTPVLELHV